MSACKSQNPKLYFIPSLHKLHQANSQYTYDSLRQLIARLQPDIIAVEIRQSDIGHDSNYLKNNYPYEMWIMRYWFPEAGIVGFDWLGDDIEGKPLSERYWREVSPIKQWERALNADTVYTPKAVSCRSISARRGELLKSLSLKELMESEDAQLTKDFYTCLAEQLKGSIHERILAFYDERNLRILKNIQGIVSGNKGKKIVVITGDDHYIALKDQLRHDPVY